MSSRLFRSLSLVTVAAVAVALASPAARAEDAKPAKEKKHQWTGTIESCDATAGTCTIKKMKDKKEESKTFTCAADCKMMGADDKPATMADLKPGEKVTVSYTAEGDKLVCHSLTIKPPKAPKAEKAK